MGKKGKKGKKVKNKKAPQTNQADDVRNKFIQDIIEIKLGEGFFVPRGAGKKLDEKWLFVSEKTQNELLALISPVYEQGLKSIVSVFHNSINSMIALDQYNSKTIIDAKRKFKQELFSFFQKYGNQLQEVHLPQVLEDVDSGRSSTGEQSVDLRERIEDAFKKDPVLSKYVKLQTPDDGQTSEEVQALRSNSDAQVYGSQGEIAQAISNLVPTLGKMINKASEEIEVGTEEEPLAGYGGKISQAETINLKKVNFFDVLKNSLEFRKIQGEWSLVFRYDQIFEKELINYPEDLSGFKINYHEIYRVLKNTERACDADNLYKAILLFNNAITVTSRQIYHLTLTEATELISNARSDLIEISTLISQGKFGESYQGFIGKFGITSENIAKSNELREYPYSVIMQRFKEEYCKFLNQEMLAIDSLVKQKPHNRLYNKLKEHLSKDLDEFYQYSAQDNKLADQNLINAQLIYKFKDAFYSLDLSFLEEDKFPNLSNLMIIAINIILAKNFSMERLASIDLNCLKKEISSIGNDGHEKISELLEYVMYFYYIIDPDEIFKKGIDLHHDVIDVFTTVTQNVLLAIRNKPELNESLTERSMKKFSNSVSKLTNLVKERNEKIEQLKRDQYFQDLKRLEAYVKEHHFLIDMSQIPQTNINAVLEMKKLDQIELLEILGDGEGYLGFDISQLPNLNISEFTRLQCLISDKNTRINYFLELFKQLADVSYAYNCETFFSIIKNLEYFKELFDANDFEVIAKKDGFDENLKIIMSNIQESKGYLNIKVMKYLLQFIDSIPQLIYNEKLQEKGVLTIYLELLDQHFKDTKIRIKNTCKSLIANIDDLKDLPSISESLFFDNIRSTYGYLYFSDILSQESKDQLRQLFLKLKEDLKVIEDIGVAKDRILSFCNLCEYKLSEKDFKIALSKKSEIEQKKCLELEEKDTLEDILVKYTVLIMTDFPDSDTRLLIVDYLLSLLHNKKTYADFSETIYSLINKVFSSLLKSENYEKLFELYSKAFDNSNDQNLINLSIDSFAELISLYELGHKVKKLEEDAAIELKRLSSLETRLDKIEWFEAKNFTRPQNSAKEPANFKDQTGLGKTLKYFLEKNVQFARIIISNLIASQKLETINSLINLEYVDNNFVFQLFLQRQASQTRETAKVAAAAKEKLAKSEKEAAAAKSAEEELKLQLATVEKTAEAKEVKLGLQLAAKTKKVAGLQSTLEAKIKEVTGLQSTLEAKIKEVADLQSTLKAKTKREADLQSTLKANTEKEADLQSTLKAKIQELEKLQKRIRGISKGSSGSVGDQITAISEILKALKAKNEEAEERKDKLGLDLEAAKLAKLEAEEGLAKLGFELEAAKLAKLEAEEGLAKLGLELEAAKLAKLEAEEGLAKLGLELTEAKSAELLKVQSEVSQAAAETEGLRPETRIIFGKKNKDKYTLVINYAGKDKITISLEGPNDSNSDLCQLISNTLCDELNIKGQIVKFDRETNIISIGKNLSSEALLNNIPLLKNICDNALNILHQREIERSLREENTRLHTICQQNRSLQQQSLEQNQFKQPQYLEQRQWVMQPYQPPFYLPTQLPPGQFLGGNYQRQDVDHVIQNGELNYKGFGSENSEGGGRRKRRGGGGKRKGYETGEAFAGKER